jgi:hypothetical protein
MKSGDTFLLPGLDDHLWMVISDPAADPDRVVVVCFLTWQLKYDQACIVEQGEHPFVTHSTCVNYPAARVETDAALERLKQRAVLKPKVPLSNQLLTRIRRSAENSDIPTEPFEILRSQGFVG